DPRAMRPAILALLLLLGGTATAHAVPPVREVARTWDGAVLFVRLESSEYRFFVLDGPIHAPYMRRAVARLDPRTLRGVIVHLHDCSYRPRDMDVRTQARFMASLGYAVVVPDSFRRLYRPATCDAARHVALPGAPHLEVLRMRRAELAHAIGRV